MTPRQLSLELRSPTDDADLKRRRWVIGLSLLGAAMGKIVSLYQTGIVRHLPDLPLPIFDADRVDASDYAYKRLQMPDGPLMVVSYAVTACLASAGGIGRASASPALPIATALKTVADAATSLELAREEWRENRALCWYCQVATVCSLASVALALPEALKAVRRLGAGRDEAPHAGGGEGRVREADLAAAGA